MERSDNVKDRIVSVTTRLIEESGGDVHKITSRAVASAAGVALGVVNYHFGSKERLITECVQRIIGRVIKDFAPSTEWASAAPKARLRAVAVYVFEFLYARPAIARISILGDLADYTADCNSVGTQRGFARFLPPAWTAGERALGAFVLTAVMQAAFLGGGTTAELLGFDTAATAGRAAFIGALVDMIWPEGEAQA